MELLIASNCELLDIEFNVLKEKMLDLNVAGFPWNTQGQVTWSRGKSLFQQHDVEYSNPKVDYRIRKHRRVGFFFVFFLFW